MANGAVFAAGVHALDNDQNPVFLLGIDFFLQDLQFFDQFFCVFYAFLFTFVPQAQISGIPILESDFLAALDLISMHGSIPLLWCSHPLTPVMHL